jgi:hypothetical protein
MPIQARPGRPFRWRTLPDRIHAVDFQSMKKARDNRSERSDPDPDQSIGSALLADFNSMLTECIVAGRCLELMKTCERKWNNLFMKLNIAPEFLRAA